MFNKLKQVNQHLKALQALQVGRIAQFSGFHLYPDKIVVADRTGVHDSRELHGVSATVNEGGSRSSRATLTRSMVPGLHGWQKGQDDRYAELIVEGPDFYWFKPLTMPVGSQFNPHDVAPARAFAGQVNHIARQVH